MPKNLDIEQWKLPLMLREWREEAIRLRDEIGILRSQSAEQEDVLRYQQQRIAELEAQIAQQRRDEQRRLASLVEGIAVVVALLEAREVSPSNSCTP